MPVLNPQTTPKEFYDECEERVSLGLLPCSKDGTCFYEFEGRHCPIGLFLPEELRKEYNAKSIAIFYDKAKEFLPPWMTKDDAFEIQGFHDDSYGTWGEKDKEAFLTKLKAKTLTLSLNASKASNDS